MSFIFPQPQVSRTWHVMFKMKWHISHYGRCVSLPVLTSSTCWVVRVSYATTRCFRAVRAPSASPGSSADSLAWRNGKKMKMSNHHRAHFADAKPTTNQTPSYAIFPNPPPRHGVVEKYHLKSGAKLFHEGRNNDKQVILHKWICIRFGNVICEMIPRSVAVSWASSRNLGWRRLSLRHNYWFRDCLKSSLLLYRIRRTTHKMRCTVYMWINKQCLPLTRKSINDNVR